ncbi:hypothetical protein PN498_06020 [Oscillatoria sp. CS-180]|uniref:hypothetical protein n=1 Tax=Oscillatoria sp. CS-180 TaxID=3021720 RepID=UPI00232EBC1C|nr:hypothetical protein [Oscillatoria sp. CS-180]MDB9525536.1 hypothetical protein [Oscillatoria sp. CS-180]
MHTLEVNLKHSPLPIMVQKETLEGAQAEYQKITEALKGGNTVTLELTCDQVPDKHVSVLVSEVAAVQFYEKSGTASASGKPPGFFALMGESSQ